MTDQRARPAQAPAFLAAVLLSTLLRYAVHERLIRADLADEAVKFITRRLTPGLVGYVVMILLGLFLPIVAVLGYLIPRHFHLRWVMYTGANE
jgi:hypothetical protein